MSCYYCPAEDLNHINIWLFSLGNHGNQSESLSVLGLGFFTCALEEVMDMLDEVSFWF